MELCYEEPMPVANNSQDFSLYFMDEALSDFDKLNYIIKKGKPFQHQALISNLSVYFTNVSFVNSLLNFLIQNIEIWDAYSQILFPNAIYKAIKYILNNVNDEDDFTTRNEIINCILTHIVFAIATYEENVTKSYISNLTLIVDQISQYSNKIKLNQNIYEFADSLGKYGQSPKNKKICVFLCSVLSKINSENRNILFKRFITLSGDNDREVKFQIAFELGNIIKVYYENEIYRGEVEKVIVFYANDDRDQICQGEAIRCLWENIILLWKNREIINLILRKTCDILDEGEYDKTNELNLIDSMVKSIYKVKKDANNNNIIDIGELVCNKGIIRRIINKAKDNNCRPQNEQAKEDNDKTNFNFLITFLVENFEELVEILCNDLTTTNEMYDIISSYDLLSKNIDYCIIYYDNLYKSLKHFPPDKLSSLILAHSSSINSNNINDIYPLFSIKNISFIIDSPTYKNFLEAISSNNSLHALIPTILQNTLSLPLLYKSQNIIFFLQSLRQIIQNIYSSLFSQREDLYSKIFIFIKAGISNNIGYHIKSASIQVLPYLMKYSKCRETYISYIHNTITLSNSYYTRRLFIPFIREAFKALSMRFIIEKTIWNDYITGIKQKVASESCAYIEIFGNILERVYNSGLGANTMQVIPAQSDKNDMQISSLILKIVTQVNIITNNSINANKKENNEEVEKYKSEILIKKKESEKLIINAEKREYAPRAFSKYSTRGKNILPPMTTTNRENKRFHYDSNNSIKSNSVKTDIENITYSNFYNAKALGYKTKNAVRVFNPIFKGINNEIVRPNTRPNIMKRQLRLINTNLKIGTSKNGI